MADLFLVHGDVESGVIRLIYRAPHGVDIAVKRAKFAPGQSFELAMKAFNMSATGMNAIIAATPGADETGRLKYP